MSYEFFQGHMTDLSETFDCLKCGTSATNDYNTWTLASEGCWQLELACHICLKGVPRFRSNMDFPIGDVSLEGMQSQRSWGILWM